MRRRVVSLITIIGLVLFFPLAGSALAQEDEAEAEAEVEVEGEAEAEVEVEGEAEAEDGAAGDGAEAEDGAAGDGAEGEDGAADDGAEADAGDGGELANTGSETGMLLVIGAGIGAAGLVFLHAGRRITVG